MPSAKAGQRSRLLVPVVVALVALIAVGGEFVDLYTEYLWFQEVQFESVFTSVLGTQVMLFVVGAVLMALFVGANAVVAYRLRPTFRPSSLEQQNLDRYRTAIEPHRRRVVLLASGFVGVLTGVTVASQWEVWALWRNAVEFGVRDPQFHRDVSYFTFTYPFQRLLLNFTFAAVVLSLVAAIAVHYLYGGVRLQTAGEKFSPAARAHLSVLLGVFVLLKALAYWLDQYGLSFSPRGKVTGASYTDVHAQLPALRILSVIAVICAVLFIANLRSRGWALPALAFGLLLVSSVVIGGVYPAVVQQLRVKPNEVRREAQYIERNIAATRAAYLLRTDEDVTYQPYSAAEPLTAQDVRADRGTLPHLRLLDPNRLRDAFESLQQIRGYYGLPKTLDIDRYTVNGETQPYVVAAREIDHEGLVPQQRNWINEHLIFTHGYGFIAAPTNTVDPDGEPVFAVKDIPPTGPIAITQPRVYYGETSPQYSVVRTAEQEIDRPVEGGEARFTYDGKGGVGVGGVFRRALFAAKFRSRYLLLSGALTGESRILFNRRPADRVQRVAPYLRLDSDPYPAIVDGRIVWIVDGYTTTDGYPYSQRVEFGAVTEDAVTIGQPRQQVNYVRNSVKATVDAYDGTVTLYRWDESDPVLTTWSRVFPGTLRPRSEMPAELLEHVRYPEDIFKVQRELLARYFVDDPAAFYSEGDFWDVPQEPQLRTGGNNARTPSPAVSDDAPRQPPYYLYFQLPGEDAPRFQLTSPLVARRRPNLAAFVSVRSEADGYGKITVLRLPTSTTVPGPEQRSATFQSDPDVSAELTLLSQQGSTVVLGNLLTLPIDNALLYVQPVYVQATSGSRIPLLKRVLVGYGDKVGFAPTFAGALAEVFQAGPSEPTDPGEPTDPVGTVDEQLRAAVADANAAYQAGLDALSRRDLAAYAAAQQRLEAALRRAAELSGSGSGASPSPSPTGSPPS